MNAATGWRTPEDGSGASTTARASRPRVGKVRSRFRMLLWTENLASELRSTNLLGPLYHAQLSKPTEACMPIGLLYKLVDLLSLCRVAGKIPLLCLLNDSHPKCESQSSADYLTFSSRCSLTQP